MQKEKNRHYCTLKILHNLQIYQKL